MFTPILAKGSNADKSIATVESGTIYMTRTGIPVIVINTVRHAMDCSLSMVNYALLTASFDSEEGSLWVVEESFFIKRNATMAWTAFTHEGTDYYGPECFMSPKNLRQWSSTDYVTDYMGNIRLTWYHNRDRDRLELTKVRISDIDYVVRSPVEEKSDEVDDKPTTPLSLLANRFVGTEIKSLLRLEALFMVATNPGKNLLEITGERQRSNRRYQKVYSRIKPLINELGLIVETRDDADIPSYHLTEIGRSAVESIDGDPEALHKALKLLLHYDIRYDHVFADLAVVLDGNEVFGDRIAELKAYKLANEKGLTGFKRNARGRYAVQLTTMGKMLRDALYNVLDLKKGE